MAIQKTVGIDTTRSWVDSYRSNGVAVPSLYVCYATDTNYVASSDRAMLNLALPGQRLPNITNWQVTEQIEQTAQQATLTVMNCMPVSTIKSTLTGPALPGAEHSPNIIAQWTQSPKGADFGELIQHDGSDITTQYAGLPPHDSTFSGPHDPVLKYTQADVQFVLYDFQTFKIADSSQFPNAALPNNQEGQDVGTISFLDETESDVKTYTLANNGVGPYFVLIDDEIIRVCNLNGSTFQIPPGGRGVAGTEMVAHAAGAPVTLLNYGPYTGTYVGVGWLNIDDYAPQTCPVRLGSCLVSYEGYGRLEGLLNHDNSDQGKNYAFTGYWFVTQVEPSIQTDGSPTVAITLASAGHMIEAQPINPPLLARLGSTEDSWQKAVWGSAEIDRVVPNQWIGFKAWDPAQMNAYPLTISTKFAQDQAYLEHYQSSNSGVNCLICRQDVIDWLASHGYSSLAEEPNPIDPDTGLGKGVNPILVDSENRTIGMHIYKESIRVNESTGGPLKTYIELMAILAMWSWDHPAMNTQLAQFFTKIPNRLYDAMRNIHTGLCFNGRLSLGVDTHTPLPGSDVIPGNNSEYDWFDPGYTNLNIVSEVDPLLCPHTVQYDQVPFTQPMQDLAGVNAASFWITREGYPVFVPQFFSFRPDGTGYRTYDAFRKQDATQHLPKEKEEWHLSYGASITEYSHSVNAEQVFSVAMASGTLPYDGSTIQVFGAGTGIMGGKRVTYSAMGGNQDALALTSGITKTTTVNLDNVILGLSWDTQPQSWGLNQLIDPSQVDTAKNLTLNGKPPLYDGRYGPLGAPSSGYDHNSKQHPAEVKKVQQTINFFLTRHYVALIVGGQSIYNIAEDGKWNDHLTVAIKALQKYLIKYAATAPAGTGINANGSPPLYKDWAPFPLTSGTIIDGVYDDILYNAILNYMMANAYEINTDIYWYAINKQSFDEYVSAITGVPVLFNSGNAFSPGNFAVDDAGTQEAVAKWAQDHFSRPLLNVANMTVDASINKATVTSVQCNLADPRIQPGDTVWLNIQGFRTQQEQPPYTNGIYVLQTSRSMDLIQGSYTMTLSGCRYVADHNQAFKTSLVSHRASMTLPESALVEGGPA